MRCNLTIIFDTNALERFNDDLVEIFLQGICIEDDGKVASHEFRTQRRANQVYWALVSMATNFEEFTNSPHLHGYPPEKICIDDSIKTDSVWGKYYKTPSFPPKLECEKTKTSFDVNNWHVRDNKWVYELMDQKTAKDYYGVYMGMDLSSNEPVQTKGVDYMQSSLWQAVRELRKQAPVFSMDWGLNDFLHYSITGGTNEEKTENKIKGEERMKIVKTENLTVAQALEKFKLDKAYILWIEENSSAIGYYDSKGTRNFVASESANNIVRTVEYDEETQVETTYFIENADEFIQKLNALKPFDKMVVLEKYAEKPKFALGEKVIFKKTNLKEEEWTENFPEELMKQILEKRVKNTEKIGIITQVRYDEDNKIQYSLFTTKNGGINATEDQLSKITA